MSKSPKSPTPGSPSSQTPESGLAGLDPSFLRGLTTPRVSRRNALRLGGLGAGALALSACGVAGTKASTANPSAEASAFWANKKKTGTLNFANWPLYIDVGSTSSDHPSIDLFTKQTGIKVKYSEVIQQDDSFFGKIQPVLAAGQSIGYDLMVITNGIYLQKLIDLGYLEPLDQAMMTNFYKNAGSIFKSPSYDPGNTYTMAWQSGMTGIGYNPKLVGHKITSWQDLQDPALKGKVGMFGDTEDMPNSAICAIGVNPETSTPSDWQKAADWLNKQKAAGIVRKYYEQDYIDPLSKGDIVASMAWSGDIFQANASGATLEFVVPEEGAPIWTDNMCIPKYSVNPVDAMTYMDFVYEPTIAAMITEYVNYVTPVPSCKTQIDADAAAATGADKASLEYIATSPLVFPSTADYSKLHRYRSLTTSEQEQWDALFEPIYQS